MRGTGRTNSSQRNDRSQITCRFHSRVTKVMVSYVARPIPPNQDKRWKLVDATIRRQGQQARGLIETLHTVQEAFGYLDEQALRYVAMSLRVPLSRAFGVATFYHFFSLKPAGQHTCV